MTTAIVVNAGSSSLKLRVLGGDDSVISALDVDSWDGTSDHSEMAAFLASAGGAGVVGHRVVHGGSRFTGPALIDDSVIAEIGALADLAPLHQSHAVAGIEACRAGLPGVPQVACFDTAFHATLPDAAARYALPGEWTSRLGAAEGSGPSGSGPSGSGASPGDGAPDDAVPPRFELRRYGFHGLSHAYAARRAAAIVGRDLGQLKIITCHLGAGASLAAVQGGRSVDTTMGFTPLEGLVMATRSGSVDPGLILWLLQRGGLSADEVSAGLEHASGLAGLAGLPGGSGDMRDVRAAAEAGDPGARLAVEVYLHRLRREIAAMAAAMNGVDVLVFTGGIGERQPPIRALVARGLGFLGVSVDPDRNQAVADADITGPSGAVRVLVITAREDVEIARQARDLVKSALR